MKWNFLFIVGVILLAIGLRFWKLGGIPIGVTHDEMGFIYNAYSIAKTGRNVLGEQLPIFTWLNQGGFPFLPVPIYLSVPVFWFLPLSATSGRLLPGVMGVLDVLLLYLLVKQILGNKNLACLSALFLAISPWHLHFSRSAYDPNYSLFFYLVGIVLFLHEARRKKIFILSTVSFFLAIYSYRAMNVLYVPLMGVLLWYGLSALKIARLQLISFVVGVCAVVFSFLIVSNMYGKAYTAEALKIIDPKIASEIDTQISESKGPLALRRVFLNKPMYIIGKLRENYVRSYSPEFLFLYTEPSKIYSIWSRGRLYFIDVIFILLGFLYLCRHTNKRGAAFIIGLVFIGGLPGMVGGFPYSARNMFLSIVFPILTAAGVMHILNIIQSKIFKFLCISILIVIYAYVFGSYLFDYYGRYAYYGAEAWNKSLQDLSGVINKNKNHYQKVIVGTASFGDLMQYAFYAREDVTALQKAWIQKKSDTYTIDNVTFMGKCLNTKYDTIPDFNASVLYVVHEGCAEKSKTQEYIRDYQKNVVWKIYRAHRIQ